MDPRREARPPRVALRGADIVRPEAEQERGTGRERAKGRRPGPTRDFAKAEADGAAIVVGGGQEVHGRGAHLGRHEAVDGLVEQLVGRAGLGDPALADDGDPLSHAQGLELVGRGVEHGHAELAVEPLELGAGVVAQLGVEVGQRLVEQEQLRATDQRPADGDPLLLATRGRGGLSAQRVADAEEFGSLLHPAVDLPPLDPGLAQGIGQVLADAEMRVEGEGLEDHRHPAPLNGSVGDITTGEPDPPGVQLLQPRDRAQRGGLPRRAGPKESHELPRLHGKRNPVQGLDLAVVLDEAIEPEVGHGVSGG